MKFLSCNYLILTLLMFSCNGQSKHEIYSITDSFQIKLDEYKIDECLNDLLWEIVKADSGNIRFPPDLYCYSLQFSNYVNYRDMIVAPSRWSTSLPRSCNGLIHISNMYFLCCGNFDRDSLFTNTRHKINLQISNKESKKYDSMDLQSNWIDWYNRKSSSTAIVGQFELCDGCPITLHINVGKKLESYFKQN